MILNGVQSQKGIATSKLFPKKSLKIECQNGKLYLYFLDNLKIATINPSPTL